MMRDAYEASDLIARFAQETAEEVIVTASPEWLDLVNAMGFGDAVIFMAKELERHYRLVVIDGYRTAGYEALALCLDPCLN